MKLTSSFQENKYSPNPGDKHNMLSKEKKYPIHTSKKKSKTPSKSTHDTKEEIYIPRDVNLYITTLCMQCYKYSEKSSFFQSIYPDNPSTWIDKFELRERLDKQQENHWFILQKVIYSGEYHFKRIDLNEMIRKGRIFFYYEYKKKDEEITYLILYKFWTLRNIEVIKT